MNYFQKNIAKILKQDLIDACTKLKNNESTRIPVEDIDDMISEFEKDTVSC